MSMFRLVFVSWSTMPFSNRAASLFIFARRCCPSRALSLRRLMWRLAQCQRRFRSVTPISVAISIAVRFPLLSKMKASCSCQQLANVFFIVHQSLKMDVGRELAIECNWPTSRTVKPPGLGRHFLRIQRSEIHFHTGFGIGHGGVSVFKRLTGKEFISL